MSRQSNSKNLPAGAGGGSGANRNAMTSPSSAPPSTTTTSACAPLLTCETVLSPPLARMEIHNEANTATTTDGIAAAATQIITYPHRQAAWQCSFSPGNGDYLAVCYGAPEPCIRVWQRRQRQRRQQQQQQQQQVSTAAAVQKDNQDDEYWVLHSTLAGVHDRTIRSVAFSPSYKPSSKLLVLASASFDGSVAIWEYRDTNHDASGGDVVVDTNDANNDATSQAQSAQSCLWECTAQLEGHDNEVKCVVWNATGTLLATCGRDKSVWIWETLLPDMIGAGSADESGGGDFECIAVLNGHNGDVKCCAFAPNTDQRVYGDGDEILLSGSYDNTIKIWAEESDTADWYCAATIADVHTSTIWSLSVSVVPTSAQQQRTRIISASDDGSLAIFQCYTVEDLKQKRRIEHQKKATGDDNNDSASQDGPIQHGMMKCVGKLDKAHRDGAVIYSVDCCGGGGSTGGGGSRNSSRIVSSGADGTIQIYREEKKPPRKKTALLAAGEDSDKEDQDDEPLFSIESTTFVGHGSGDVNCVCWHPSASSASNVSDNNDGAMTMRLASTSDDGTVRVWRYQVPQ